MVFDPARAPAWQIFGACPAGRGLKRLNHEANPATIMIRSGSGNPRSGCDY